MYIIYLATSILEYRRASRGVGTLAMGSAQLLAFTPLASPSPTACFKCKNATADWPKCRPPTDGFRLRFGRGSAAAAPRI